MSKRFPRRLVKAGLLAMIPAVALALGSRPKGGDEEATNLRLLPVAKVKLAAPAAASAAPAASN